MRSATKCMEAGQMAAVARGLGWLLGLVALAAILALLMAEGFGGLRVEAERITTSGQGR